MSLAATNKDSNEASGVDGLVQYLRFSRPVHGTTAEQLAARFDLRTEFVQEVLDALQAPQETTATIDLVWKGFLRGLSRGWQEGRALWLRMTDNPMAFVVTTGLIGYLASYYLQVAALQGTPSLSAVTASQILPFTFLLHQLCFARYGMLRYPIFAAGAVGLAAFLIKAQQHPLGGQADLVKAVASALSFGALYAFLGSVAALIGGYVAVQRRARSIMTLSRQEALDRLFLLKERYARIQAQLDKPARKGNWLGIVHNYQKWPLIALMGGFVFGLLRVLVLGGYQQVFPEGGGAGDPVYATFQIFSVIVTSAAFLGIGYLSGGILKGIASQFIGFAGLFCSTFFRLGVFGPQMAMGMLDLKNLIPFSVLLVLSGLLSGAGARIEEAARRERGRDREDPVALIAEMVLLERKLSAKTAARCVMSVDVARSTAMKADQDPLIVEWSFREYQKVLTESAEQGGGFVLSTSGDGTILTFSDCSYALRTAKDIHTRLEWFNMRVNRLNSPFRVRIGIHSAEVQGDLSDVQFAQVIDIAAHVQGHAPVGGILVTESIADHAPDEPLTELKDPVEGFKVLLVVNPTVSE